MHVAYIGNFEPEFSTENEYARAFEANGHTVLKIQEGDPNHYLDALAVARGRLDGDERWIGIPDFILWTRTAGLAVKWGHAAQWKLLAEARRHAVPVVGVHLDLWHNLERAEEIEYEPFFYVDLLLTADGGHDDLWGPYGVNHRWLPAGVSDRWCRPGTPNRTYQSDLAFIGNWQGGYHPEAEHRHQLVRWLDETYGDRVKFWPRPGKPAIRGGELNDLVWSTKIVVGDSCLIPNRDGSPMTRYQSDRITEIMGRGGCIAHPEIEGASPMPSLSWPLGDWDELRAVLDAALERGTPSDDMRLSHIDFIREHHTYERRVPQMLQIMVEEGLL